MQSTTPTDTKRFGATILSACLKPVVRDRPVVADCGLLKEAGALISDQTEWR
jgi:hypothetical protein